ncbi:hypothetical protein K0M31_012189, partial [Melipona bicolor]
YLKERRKSTNREIRTDSCKKNCLNDKSATNDPRFGASIHPVPVKSFNVAENKSSREQGTCEQILIAVFRGERDTEGLVVARREEGRAIQRREGK